MTSRTLNKEKIINVAMDLITEQQPLTFSNISRRLGTHSQALYNYFPDVTALNASIDEAYNDGLLAEIRQQLVGVSGEEAVLKFAFVSREYALAHFQVTQFTLAIPRELLNQGAVQNSSSYALRQILYQLLKTLDMNNDLRLNATRMIRNLIIGEIVNVGRDWFKNEEVKDSESFKQMLLLALHHLDEL